MRKKFFILLFLFLPFLGFLCSDIPIADDICAVTTEICDYANKICDIYSTVSPVALDSVQLKAELAEATEQLFTFQMTLATITKHYSPTSENIYREQLSAIRDKLKHRYEKMQHLEK